MLEIDAIHNRDITPKRSWGGRRRFTMTLEEEREFLADWEDRALAGAIHSVFPIHDALEKRLGHDIILSTTYRILERHGWKKVYPEKRPLTSISGGERNAKRHATRLWMPPLATAGNKI